MRPRIVACIAVASFCAVAGCRSSQPTSEPPSQPLARQSVYGLSKEERRERFQARQDEGVGYYNPKTGYTADYTLDVEYTPDGEVDRINFPNGGWIDDFESQEEHANGTITVTTDDGREFTVPKMDDADEDVVNDDDDHDDAGDADRDE